MSSRKQAGGHSCRQNLNPAKIITMMRVESGHVASHPQQPKRVYRAARKACLQHKMHFVLLEPAEAGAFSARRLPPQCSHKDSSQSENNVGVHARKQGKQSCKPQWVGLTILAIKWLLHNTYVPPILNRSTNLASTWGAALQISDVLLGHVNQFSVLDAVYTLYTHSQ